MTKPVPTPTAKPKSRYRGDRRATTVVLSGALVKLAQEYFPHTRSGCLSSFIEATLAAKFRKDASAIRKHGLKLPESVFAK